MTCPSLKTGYGKNAHRAYSHVLNSFNKLRSPDVKLIMKHLTHMLLGQIGLQRHSGQTRSPKYTLILLAIPNSMQARRVSAPSLGGASTASRSVGVALSILDFFPTANLLACQLIFPAAHRTGKFYAYICACHFPTSK